MIRMKIQTAIHEMQSVMKKHVVQMISALSAKLKRSKRGDILEFKTKTQQFFQNVSSVRGRVADVSKGLTVRFNQRPGAKIIVVSSIST